MTGEPLTFTLRVDHNENLGEGQHELDAIVQVGAAEPDPHAAGGPPRAAEVIIIDASKSMTGLKISQARLAASAAVDVVRDGAYFAVVAGQTSARLVYPPQPRMIAATAETRAMAKSEIA